MDDICRNIGNCWFYLTSMRHSEEEYAESVAALQGGATRLRPNEVVVRVDAGVTLYVLPDAIFGRLVANLISEREKRFGMVFAKETALHENTAVLPNGRVWKGHTLGNLTGGGSVLLSNMDALPADFPAAGTKLANVVISLARGEPPRMISWTKR